VTQHHLDTEAVVKSVFSQAIHLYMADIVQVLVFFIASPSTFVAGMLSSIGGYIVPLLDKSAVLGNILFYLAIAFGAFALIRFVVLAHIYTLNEPKHGIISTIISLLVVFIIVIGGVFVFYIDSAAELLQTSDLKSLMILSSAVLALLFFGLWLKTFYKATILAALGCLLIGIFLAGNLYMQYQINREGDFELFYGANQAINVNILYRSTEGVLVIDSKSKLPAFFPWDNIHEIRLSAARGGKIKTQNGKK